MNAKIKTPRKRQSRSKKLKKVTPKKEAGKTVKQKRAGKKVAKSTASKKASDDAIPKSSPKPQKRVSRSDTPEKTHKKSEKKPAKKGKKVARNTSSPQKKRKKSSPAKKKGARKSASAKLPARPRSAKKAAIIADETLLFREEALINTDWKAAAGFKNITPRAFTSLSCRMVVPQAPAEKVGQTIMLFIGLQSQQRIIQPILQWGRTQMQGGGRFWSVGCCLAAGQFTLEENSDMIPVNEGEELTAVIQLTGKQGNRCRYRCFFEGIPESEITTANIEELKIAVVTLEARLIGTRAHYPPDQAARISDVVLENEQGILRPTWAINGAGTLGERAIVRSVGGAGDDIDIIF